MGKRYPRKKISIIREEDSQYDVCLVELSGTLFMGGPNVYNDDQLRPPLKSFFPYNLPFLNNRISVVVLLWHDAVGMNL